MGRKRVDDGALLIIAKDDRTLRIEVGYGLEGVLTDATSKRIISEVISPRFKTGDFYGGVKDGVQSMQAVIEGEALPPPSRSTRDGGVSVRSYMPVILVLTLVFGGALRDFLGRFPGAVAAGGAVALVAWLLSGAIFVAFTAGVIALIYTLLGPGMVGHGGSWSTGSRSGRGGIRRWQRRFRRWQRRFRWRRRWFRWWWCLGKMVMENIKRILSHLLTTHWRVRRAFPRKAMRAIGQAIAQSESSHVGHLCFAVEGALSFSALWKGVTARERALEVFSQLRVWDTEQNNGVLIYLLLADRSVEIVADRGIHARVGAQGWQAICSQMEAACRRAEYERGVIDGIRSITLRLTQHFPARDRREQRLPGKPVIL